jgi:hypothetical protein
MTIITSKMNASASYSDLDARTQFVLNRLDFLKSIAEVLQHEDCEENAAKVTVWRDNSYIPLIVRCILDPNEEIYDHAIWATGNLLGSDDERVALMTRAAITDDIIHHLIEIAGRTTLSIIMRRGVNYLIYNLSREKMSSFFNQSVGGDLLEKMLEYTHSKEARNDFLAAIENISKHDPTAIRAQVIAEALLKDNRTHGWRRLLKIIGSLAEKDSVIGPTVIDRLMTFFTRALKKNSSRNRVRHEILWVLSNIMTEIASPVLLAQYHTELKEIVYNIAWDELCSGKDDPDMVLGREALYVLSNFVVAAKCMSSTFKANIAEDMTLESLFNACVYHDDGKIAQIGNEMLELLVSFKPEVIDLTEDTESEVEDAEDEDEDEDEDEEEEDECYIHPPAVRLAQSNEAIHCECCERPVPSATDLLLGANRGNESSSVRRVVNLLVHLPVGEWAAIPADWTLTVADLTVLQHLGYIIQDGHVGINPEIYSYSGY